MKKNFVVFPALVLGMAALVAGPDAADQDRRSSTCRTPSCRLRTGRRPPANCRAKFAPKKAELDKKQADIASLQDQLRKGSATMSDEAKAKLMRDIDANNKSLQRDTEDAQADLEQEQGKIMQELGNKVMAVLEKYATANGYAIVLDVSNPQTPVLWAASAIDITNDIVKLYDQANPGTGPSTAKAPGTAPAAPRPAGTAPATNPLAPAAKKK